MKKKKKQGTGLQPDNNLTIKTETQEKENVKIYAGLNKWKDGPKMMVNHIEHVSCSTRTSCHDDKCRWPK